MPFNDNIFTTTTTNTIINYNNKNQYQQNVQNERKIPDNYRSKGRRLKRDADNLFKDNELISNYESDSDESENDDDNQKDGKGLMLVAAGRQEIWLNWKNIQILIMKKFIPQSR